MKKCIVMAAVALAWVTAHAAPPTLPSDVDGPLKAMSGYVKALPSLEYRVTGSMDDVAETGVPMQVNHTDVVRFKRPNHLYVDTNGDVFRSTLWFDGTQLTVLDKDKNVYLQESVPGTVAGLLQRLYEEYEATIPLADLLADDPYAVLTETLGTGLNLGAGEVEGTACHHLQFSEPGLDWQLWVTQGTPPQPKKMVLTFGDTPQRTQYTGVIQEWKTKSLGAGAFKVALPEGARKVSLEAFVGADAKKESP